MHSLLEHIRDIRRRRATYASSSSSSRTPKSPTSFSQFSPVEAHTPSLSIEISPSSRTSEQLIDRRIHPDIDSLLASPDVDDVISERLSVVAQNQSPRRSFYGLGGLSPSRPSPRKAAKRTSSSPPAVKEETNRQIELFHNNDTQLQERSSQQFPSINQSSDYQRFPSIDSPERWSTFGRRHSRRNRFSQSQEYIERDRSYYSRSEMSSIQTHSRSHSSGGFFGRKRKKKDSSASRPSSSKSANTFFNPNHPPQITLDTTSRPRTGSAVSQNSPNSASGDSASKHASSIRSSSAKWSDALVEAGHIHGSSENVGTGSPGRHANASSLLLPVAPGDSPSFGRLPLTPHISQELGVESPQTFGQRTPAHRSAPDLLYVDSPTLPPSLPIPIQPKTTRSLELDHQSNYSNLFALSHSNSSLSPSSGQERRLRDLNLDQNLGEDGEEGRSYPLKPSRRENHIPTLSTTTFGNITNSRSSSFPSLSFTFGNPFRHSSSNQAFSDSSFPQQEVYRHPKVEHIFSLSTTQLGEQGQNEDYNSRQAQQHKAYQHQQQQRQQQLHEGSKSAYDLNITSTRKDNGNNNDKTHRQELEDRRDSAKWSAQQATDGAVVEPPHDYGWPAIVSREMVRISLEDRDKPRSAYERVQGKSAGTGRGFTDDARVSRVSSTSRHKRYQHSSSDNVLPKPFSQLSLPSSSSPQPPPPPPPPSSTTATTLAASPALLLPTSARHFGADFSHHRQRKTEGLTLSGSGDNIINNILPSPRRSRSLGDNHLVPIIVSDTTERSGQEGASSFRSQSISKGSGSLRHRSKVSIVDGNDHNSHLSRMKTSSSTVHQEQQHPSSILLKPPNVAVTAPTSEGSSARVVQPSSSSSQITDEHDSSALQVPSANVTPPRSDKASGKRKAEESEDGSPPRQKSAPKVTTFAVQEGRGTPRVSNSSHAPSSFNSYGRKRPRVSSSPMTTPDRSNPGSIHEFRTPSRNSVRATTPHTPSRPGSHKETSIVSSGEGGAITRSNSQKRQSRHQHQNSRDQGSQRQQRRQSMSQYSQTSIPISAILSPHAPSIDRLSTFHMRDPRKPPLKRSVGWTLKFSSGGEPGSPMQAWCFWVGFVLPPIWWLAAFWSIPETRIVGADTEKAVTVDDPQIERDARAWRRRCRIVSVLFFFTYAPVIILLAIFAPRR